MRNFGLLERREGRYIRHGGTNRAKVLSRSAYQGEGGTGGRGNLPGKSRWGHTGLPREGSNATISQVRFLGLQNPYM